MIKKHIKFIIISGAVLFSALIFFRPVPTHAATMFNIEPLYKVLTPNASAYPDSYGFDPKSYGYFVAYTWQLMMNAVNSLVLLVLVYVAFMNILRLKMDSYAVKKILPTFIMAVIMANFSFLICRIIIDIGNVAVSLFLLGDTNNKITSAFDSLIKAPPTSPDAFNADPANSGATYAGYIFAYSIKQLLLMVGSVLMFILSFIFLIRNIMIYFLVAISPAAFMTMILPNTSKYFQQWWSNMTKWVFMPVVSVFWLWLAGQFMQVVGSPGTEGGAWFLPLAFAGLCFYMAITSPFKMDKAIVGAWGGLGKKAWGKTGGQVTNYAKNRIGEEYNFNKAKVANWAASKRFVPTRRGMMTPRQTAAFKRQRLAGPGMVTAKAVEDADATALKGLLDDHYSGRKALPSAIVSRYNAQLRKRYMDEASSLKDAGTGTLLDNNLRTVGPDGLLAMPTFDAGAGSFASEEALKQHMARIGAIKTTLGKARNNRDRERLIASLATVQADGNTRLGHLLGHNIDSEAHPDFERGLDTLRALDIGPYNNTPGNDPDRNALEANAASYRLRGTPGAPAPAPVPSSAVPGGRPSTGGTAPATPQQVIAQQDPQLIEVMREMLQTFKGMEAQSGGEGSLGGSEGFDQILAKISEIKPEMTLDKAGLAAMILPDRIKVEVAKYGPETMEQLRMQAVRAASITAKVEANLQDHNLGVLRNIYQTLKSEQDIGVTESKVGEAKRALEE